MLREYRDKIPDGLDTKVFTPKFLPEAFSAEGQLDDPRRADITLGQLLCMTGGYTGEGGAPMAMVMGRAFPLKPCPARTLLTSMDHRYVARCGQMRAQAIPTHRPNRTSHRWYCAA